MNLLDISDDDRHGLYIQTNASFILLNCLIASFLAQLLKLEGTKHDSIYLKVEYGTTYHSRQQYKNVAYLIF